MPTTIELIIYGWLGFLGFACYSLLLYFLIPLENRAKFKSLLLKKPYGILEICGKGKEIRRHVVNFSKDYAIVEGKVFVLIPERVYRKSGVRCLHVNELDALDPIAFVGQELNEKDIENLSDELKRIITSNSVIFSNPVSFEKNPKEKYANPELIKAIFMKQKALAEAKTLFEEKSFKFILFAVLVISALAIAFSYMNYDKMTNFVEPTLKTISSTLQSLKAKPITVVP